MSDEISVILELTEREAAVLYSLTLRGVSWGRSGDFGAAVEDIFFALDDVISPTAGYVSDLGCSKFAVWEKIS